MNIDKITTEAVEARETAERKLGFSIPDDVAIEVFDYTMRKLEVIKKPIEYLPVLFENELRDHYMRLAINLRGAMNRCATSAT